ncbi:class I SAM-dependent methyltransferase [Streptomyces sp. BI20]|uniref:class I SAM-dependent methyltransferase n=1 Tax=Streptomyces sp. BI20 TaxID=3403460 RepID=UPI003C7722F5
MRLDDVPRTSTAPASGDRLAFAVADAHTLRAALDEHADTLTAGAVRDGRPGPDLLDLVRAGEGPAGGPADTPGPAPAWSRAHARAARTLRLAVDPTAPGPRALPELPAHAAFDAATAFHLFDLAGDRAALHALFAAIRTVLRPGGRLLAVVSNAGAFPGADWTRYGLRVRERLTAGDAPLVRVEVLTDPPLRRDLRAWSHADFAEAAVEAGFARVGWRPVRTPPPTEERDEAFWADYRARPISSLMTATA